MRSLLFAVMAVLLAVPMWSYSASEDEALAELKEKQMKKQKGVPGQVAGDEKLLDTDMKAGFVVDLDSWYKGHLLEKDDKGQEKPTRGDTIYKSPRSKIDVVTNKGPLIGLHYHASADEIVVIYKGTGEMYINGKWTPVHDGQIHVNPRGVIHATRVVGNEKLYVFSIFTPPQLGGDDKIFMDGIN
jgi:mannose-6-phosphate isomerase-like protein (cupin superfamily)